MQRMRRLFVLSFLALLAVSTAGRPADASLILNPAPRSYPDITAFNLTASSLSYTYDPTTQTGQFKLVDTPTFIGGDPANANGYAISPDASGIQSEVLNIALDKNGVLVPTGSNSFSLTGTVDAGGQHFSGVLLTGTPTQFGSLDLGPNASGSSLFDLQMNVTGGLLKPFYGPDAYMKVYAELSSTFAGKFDQNFSAEKITTNTRAYHSPQPFPIPEPTTLVVVLMGGAGVTYRHRRRLLTA